MTRFFGNSSTPKYILESCKPIVDRFYTTAYETAHQLKSDQSNVKIAGSTQQTLLLNLSDRLKPWGPLLRTGGVFFALAGTIYAATKDVKNSIKDFRDDLKEDIKRIDNHMLSQDEKIDKVSANLTERIDKQSQKIDNVNANLTERIDKQSQKIDKMSANLAERIDKQSQRIDSIIIMLCNTNQIKKSDFDHKILDSSFRTKNSINTESDTLNKQINLDNNNEPGVNFLKRLDDNGADILLNLIERERKTAK